uniref:Tetraspanin-15 n=1 Tax=Chelydra serpentina TaxID=8475 RepID=A0A8C3SK32_CHESE
LPMSNGEQNTGSSAGFPYLIIGLVILCIGVYAEVERQKHRTLEGIFLAPAVVLLLLGITMFAVSFIGMVGSLRDNRTLLKMTSKNKLWILICLLLFQVLGITFSIFHSNIQEGIRHYYDDLDFKNILDFVQEKFSCCGGDEYKDWNVNQYHSCNGSGPLACGVPYTCCIKKVPGEVINTLCGFKTLEKERLQLVDVIHVRGCIHAVGLWFKDNFEVTFGIVCSLLLPQVRENSLSLTIIILRDLPTCPFPIITCRVMGDRHLLEHTCNPGLLCYIVPTSINSRL